MLNRKRIAIALSFLMIFLSGCSRYGSQTPVSDAFQRFGESITWFILNEQAILGIMFIAFLFGTFALYKALLRFSFKESHSFRNKEINVIAFMIAFMSTVGIFFIFRGDEVFMIHLFGGFAGLLFVLFLIIFLMNMMKNFADSVKDEEGILGKGPGWIFIMVLGIIFSSYLLIGYSWQVLSGANCIPTSTLDIRTFQDGLTITSSSQCNSAAMFATIINIGKTILSWALFFGVIFGLWWMLGKKGDDEDEHSRGNHNNNHGSGLFGLGKHNRSDEEKSEIKKMQTVTNRMVENFKELEDNVKEQEKLMNSLNSQLKAQIGKPDNTTGGNR